MSKTYQEALDCVEALSKTDTGLGGFLNMHPTSKGMLAMEMLRFADPEGFLNYLNTWKEPTQ